VELKLHWYYDATTPELNKKTDKSALEQLQENSKETNLKLGSVRKVRAMLEHLPLLFNIKRATIRNIEFYLKDLFVTGGKGYMEYKKEDAAAWSATGDSISVKKIDVTSQLRHAARVTKEGGRPVDGLTLDEFMKNFWVFGLAPQVIKGSIVRAAFTQISGAALSSAICGGKDKGGGGPKGENVVQFINYEAHKLGDQMAFLFKGANRVAGNKSHIMYMLLSLSFFIYYDVIIIIIIIIIVTITTSQGSKCRR
jgi:hypothetical protein